MCINSSWNLYNFRANLIRSLVADGYEVYALAPRDQYSERVKEFGCTYIPIYMDAKAVNPLKDFITLIQIIIKLYILNPDCLLGFTVKPNIYGSVAASILKIKIINNIAGLGLMFNKGKITVWLLEIIYKAALLKSAKVFFQNRDDLKRFVERKIVDKSVVECLPGSGVDLERFTFLPISCDKQKSFRFLLVSRLIWSKGVGEYVGAARVLKNKYPRCEFCLLGFAGVKNPDSIPESIISEWVAEGVINYLGWTDQVQLELAKSHCVVLPSYYPEGVPRSLLEAAAVGRPIITTNSVGCRDVVSDGVNGFLCLPRDIDDLTNKMEKILSLSIEDLSAMGKRSRGLVEARFDEKIVVNMYRDILRKMW